MYQLPTKISILKLSSPIWKQIAIGDLALTEDPGAAAILVAEHAGGGEQQAAGLVSLYSVENTVKLYCVLWFYGWGGTAPVWVLSQVEKLNPVTPS